jgi:hypothetical protein
MMTQQQRTVTSVCLAAMLCGAATSVAEDHRQQKPRPQFVTISYDWLDIRPLHFAKHPLEDLVGSAVEEAQFEDYDYKAAGGRTLIDVLEFKRRGHGAGVTVYPFGMSVGTTLALRGSIEALPVIRIAFDGPAAVSSYALTNGQAYDGAIGIYVADRSRGWGIGSHAFVAGGAGRLHSDLGGGSRYFAEGGGGVSSGPFGLELSVKFAWNRLSAPIEHRFMTVPIALRGTVSF